MPLSSRTTNLDLHFRFALPPTDSRQEAEIDFNNKNKKFRYCIQCYKEWKSSTTTNCRIHLKSAHNIVLEPDQTIVQEEQQCTILPKEKFLTKDDIDDAITQFIITNSLPLSIVESTSFRHLLFLLHPEIGQVTIKTRPSLRSYVTRQWKSAQAKIDKIVHRSQSEIHISLDLWTSPNNYLFLGVIAHFVEDNRPKSLLLGMKQAAGHSGEQQFSTLRPILETYQITSQLRALIGDNSTTNDTLAREISAWLGSLNISVKWDFAHNRTRCLGHIINLIVQSFLFHENSLISQQEMEDIDRLEELGPSDKELEDSTQEYNNRFNEQISRSFGVLGKAHNITCYIRRSPGRTQEFLASQRSNPKRIPMDNRTRWNSWYNMLEVFVELEGDIDLFCKTQHELKDDRLSIDDWTILKQIKTFLEVFNLATKSNEGQYHDISNAIPTLAPIHTHIGLLRKQLNIDPKRKQPSSKKKVVQPSILAVSNLDIAARLESCERAWQKWWSILITHPLYLIATVLNPLYRKPYLENVCRHLNVSQSKSFELMKQIWIEWKNKLDAETRCSIVRRKTLNRINNIKEGKHSSSVYDANAMFLENFTEQVEKDEWDFYLQEPPLIPENPRDFKPLNWWLDESTKKRWPMLSKLAISILSIPAMSADVERLFSTARRTISWDRGSLIPDTIEELECLKHFWRQEEKWEKEEQ